MAASAKVRPQLDGDRAEQGGEFLRVEGFGSLTLVVVSPLEEPVTRFVQDAAKFKLPTDRRGGNTHPL